MRASVGRRAARHARRVHAEVVGDPTDHRNLSDPILRLCRIAPAADWAAGEHLCSRREVLHMDDPPAVCVRHELSHIEVPAGTEQDDGDDMDNRRSAGVPYDLQLAADAEAGMGAAWCSSRAQCVLVVHSHGSAGVYHRRRVRQGLERILVEGVPESLGFCSPLACLGGHGMVSVIPNFNGCYVSLLSRTSSNLSFRYPMLVISLLIIIQMAGVLLRH